MELPNHLLPWDTVKKLLKGAWAEGYDEGHTDGANHIAPLTPNPYDKEDA